MSLIEKIQDAVKTGNVILGYRKSVQYIKTDTPDTIVVAENVQSDKKREIEHDAALSGTKVEVFEGSSKELGVICGKPFPISTLVIKKLQ